MLSTDVLLLFITASAALSLAPGPDNLFVLTQSALHGRRTGILVTLGLCTGLVFHITAVALGIAAIFKTSAVAFTVVKIVGASYLLYLAWQSFRAGNSNLSDSIDQPVSALRLYARGILMNITNPKVAIFFLAFFPQFVAPERGSVTAQVFMLGLAFIVTAFVIFTLISLAASQIGNWLKQSQHAQVVINRLAGTVFTLLACRLVLSKQ